MRAILQIRFDALAGYCRRPETILISRELEWFEFGGERILATLILDTVDQDYGGIILGRDEAERFRWVGGSTFHDGREEARAALNTEVERLAANIDLERKQGDRVHAPVDFFAPRVARASAHPDFLKLAENEGFSPARGIIEPMMRWYEDLDGNFIQQFQTTGFDARLWELYLFATFTESGFAIEHVHAVPDFTCTGLMGTLCVEATTVNATRDASGNVIASPPVETRAQIYDYQRQYMPVKYASALTTKLKKRYWERTNVTGKPLVFAIHDFQAPMSMLTSRAGLPIYLYGYDHDWTRDANGQLTIHPRRVETHQWGTKVIPSNFFALPDAENVSAVIFSNSGTISKFNRMGVLAGFGSKRVRLVRDGLVLDHDPNASEPKRFRHLVNDPSYGEKWIEGLDVFHNPRARYPISPHWLPGAAHHRQLDDGQMQSVAPDWQPLSSITQIHVIDDERGAQS